MFWVFTLDFQSPSNSAGGSKWSIYPPWFNLPCHPHCSHVVGVSGLPEYLLFLCREGGLGMEWACLTLGDWRSFLPLMPLRHLFSPSWWNVTGINKESASCGLRHLASSGSFCWEEWKPHTCSPLFGWWAVRAVDWQTVEWIKALPISLLVVS